MKGIYAKQGAKAVAVLLLLLSVFTAGMCGAGALQLENNGIYNQSKGQVQKRMDQDMLAKYSVTALARYLQETDEETGDNFRYAIFEGDVKAAGLAEAKPLAGNVNEAWPDKVVIHTFSINEESEFALASGIFDSAYVHEHDYAYDTWFEELYLLRGMDGLFVGDEENNTLYRLDDSVWWTDQADLAVGDQTELAAGGETAISPADGAASSDAVTTEQAETGTPAGASNEAAAADAGKTGNVESADWRTLYVKDSNGTVASWDRDDIEVISDLNSRGLKVSSQKVRHLNLLENTFTVGQSPKEASYTVASYVKRPLTEAKLKDDMDFFQREDLYLEWAYRLRYLLLALLPVAGVIALLSFAFLMRAAGHRDGEAAVVRRGLDRLPMDVYAVFAIVAAGCLGALTDALAGEFWRNHIVLASGVVGAGATAIAAIALAFLMSLAVNCKARGLWKRTLLYRLFHWIGRGTSKLWHSADHIAMGRRVAAVFAGLCVGEFFLLLLFQRAFPMILLLWAVEKVLLAVLVARLLREFGRLKSGAARIAEGNLDYQLDTEGMFVDLRAHGETLNQIGQGLSEAVEERMKSERMKTELITNVSHDIKTPLTSIINYTDLLSGLDLEDPRAQEYLEVLSRQSGRLKKLIEDLIEASKASSGSLKMDIERVDAGMVLLQALGEFDERLRNRGIEYYLRNRCQGETAMVLADSRYLWRLFDNLITNICKYAQPGTRAYIDLLEDGSHIRIIFRNVSEAPLNITGDELMERFVRGDSARSTEGSGLGLSIASSLAQLMGGSLQLTVDGDLFKVDVVLRKA